jgi:hypothetical protein
MWLVRELRAQVSRFALALGVVACGVVAFGTCLPLVAGGTRLGAPARAYGSSPVSLDNSLIRYPEGWMLLAIVVAALLLLGVYRRYRLGRPVVTLLAIGIALAVPVSRIARQRARCSIRAATGLPSPPGIASVLSTSSST